MRAIACWIVRQLERLVFVLPRSDASKGSLAGCLDGEPTFARMGGSRNGVLIVVPIIVTMMEVVDKLA